jgi:hypothetical protein
MSCIFGVLGAEFDPLKFLETTRWKDATVYEKGTPAGEDGRLVEKSYVFVHVSDATYTDLEGQTRDAIVFLNNNRSLLSAINDIPGVEYAHIVFTLDLGISGFVRNFGRSFDFPWELTKIAGELGIIVDLRIFPDKGDDQGDKS